MSKMNISKLTGLKVKEAYSKELEKGWNRHIIIIGNIEIQLNYGYGKEGRMSWSIIKK